MDEKFNQVWARPDQYPDNLVRPLRSYEQHERTARRDKVEEEKKALFDASQQKLEFWESGIPVVKEFNHYVFSALPSLKGHLEKTKNSLRIRHVFLQSDNSRSPLNCHVDMFKTVCTYHQVEPFILDSVHTFGEQDDPKDLCLMQFRSHDTLTVPKEKLAAIPKLNRSGREIHVSYLLRAPEIKKNAEWKWQIRQAAVYHTFDTETGRSFWFTMKGNDEFNRRISQSLPYLDLPTTDPTGQTTNGSHIPANTTSAYFSASLSTHLVYLSWCDENWRQYVNDLEDGIRHILELARHAPIDDDLKDTASLLKTYPKSLRETGTRNSTMRPHKPGDHIAKGSKANSKMNTGLSIGTQPVALRKRSTLEVIEGTGNALLHYLSNRGGGKMKIGDPEKDPAGTTTAPRTTGGLFAGPVEDPLGHSSDDEEDLVDTRVVLNKFRFSDVQTLYAFSDRIRRAILTLTLNISVLGEMHAYHKDRLLDPDLDAFRHIRDGCKNNGDSINEFLREIKSLSQRLETRRSQLECLGSLLIEGNALYDGILQYRQLDISQRFQETSQESADYMQVMSNKTRIETASMHVITVVTMIFLPATFVATFFLPKTFFQSGVLLWNDESPSQIALMESHDESFRYRGDAFSLFGKVSLPMMIVTVGIWLGVFLWMRRGIRKDMARRAEE